jgi:hypothetical protein
MRMTDSTTAGPPGAMPEQLPAEDLAKAVRFLCPREP